MTTEAIRSPERAATEGARVPRAKEGFLQFLQSVNMTERLCPTVPATTCVTWMAPKMLEANRQIERLTCARKFAEERGGNGDDLEGVASCISLLGHFAAGPVPVPVASWTAGEGASLFLSTDRFYGDLEIDGDQLEYLLRWDSDGKTIEVFDTETLEGGRVPPRLLARLFSVFAKQNAAMR